MISLLNSYLCLCRREKAQACELLRYSFSILREIYEQRLNCFRRKNEADQKKHEAAMRAEQDLKRRRRMEREERRRLKKLGLVIRLFVYYFYHIPK